MVFAFLLLSSLAMQVESHCSSARLRDSRAASDGLDRGDPSAEGNGASSGVPSRSSWPVLCASGGRTRAPSGFVSSKGILGCASAPSMLARNAKSSKSGSSSTIFLNAITRSPSGGPRGAGGAVTCHLHAEGPHICAMGANSACVSCSPSSMASGRRIRPIVMGATGLALPLSPADLPAALGLSCGVGEGTGLASSFGKSAPPFSADAFSCSSSSSLSLYPSKLPIFLGGVSFVPSAAFSSSSSESAAATKGALAEHPDPEDVLAGASFDG
mmetsp:Transcript_21217/g.49145  ORF Transcript_21217/g.49145 Transcript_21217/m.49145 type:complete len:271 (+) Transcript_21217:460-1272(+)